MGDKSGLCSSSRIKTKTKYRKTSYTKTKLEEKDELNMGKHKSECGPSGSKDNVKERKPKSGKRERWLLTRKTWRYMADAGRKLIPEGALNRPEDVPKIEDYFQHVCRKEPRFLLWRKQSYPGALGFRAKGRGRGGRLKTNSIYRDRTSSADEADDIKKVVAGTSGLSLEVKQQGRFDLKRLKEEFLLGARFAPSTEQETSQLRPPGWTGKQGSPNVPGSPKPLGSPKASGSKLSTVEETSKPQSDDGKLLIETLNLYLKEEGVNQADHASSKTGGIDHQQLLDKLRQHLNSIENVARDERKKQPRPSGVQFEGDHVQKMLLETLRRHFSRSTNRDRVISDLLTDRKLLEKLHFDLRRARGFTGKRRGPEYVPRWNPWSREKETYNEEDEDEHESETRVNCNRGDAVSPPPTIEIEEIKEQRKHGTTPFAYGTQTEPLSSSNMVALDVELKRQKQLKLDAEAQELKEQQKSATFPRRTSVTDNDDVSPSVSDTIKRYLRMARKKSIDSDKASRFNTVNYDRNLRNIKPKGEITKISDDDGLDKGCQTDESWIAAFKELKLEELSSPADEGSSSRITSSRSSVDTGTEELTSPVSIPLPPTKSPSGILSTGQNFLSNLLHSQKSRQVTGSSVPTAVQAMQKSKSSSSVVHHGRQLVAKKIWKTRSKSSSRATPSVTSIWTPQGRCVWTNVTGKAITLTDTSLLNLTEIERKVLQKVALAKLQALNLGVNVRIPNDSVGGTTVQKPKRRAYLIKRKAITTSIFDINRGKDDKEKGEGTTSGMVFGIPLGQCVENERLARIEGGSRSGDVCGGDEHSELRRKSHHGSRGSFSSLNDFANKQEERGSCESLTPTLSMPGMLDTLSCSSALDLDSEHSGVPNIVTSCLRHLETYGLHTLGIFRVSSSKKRVRQLREEFDYGKEILLDDKLCPHDVATLLKEYFRDLPDSLLCKDLYQAFIQTQRIRNRRLQNEALKHLIQLLPVANRDTLWALLNTLSTIANNSCDRKDLTGEWVSGNKMDSNNLATLFAPNILHSCPKSSGVASKDELSAERTEERSDAINVIRTLIDSFRSLYQVPAEMLDEVYVHMMDSHPEVLDQLLQRRELANDDLQDDQETSTVSEDTGGAERLQPPIDSQESLLSTSSDDRGRERRVWSREAFTHEHAGMGGPDVEMRPRKERDRTRERITKKRWKDEPTGRRRLDSDHSGGGSTTPSRRTSATYQDDDRGRYYSSAETSGQHTPDDQMMFGDRSMDVGVITASLKIPVPASTSFTLNLDDTDIPFIEDSERQHMTFGMVRSSSSSHRMSGSDSSQASTYIHQIQYPGQTDSAVGSSAGISSPPRNTTPSVSSYSSGGVFSSPPSWASSPPTSPDHSVTTVNYIPEEATTARIIIPTKKSSEPQQRPVILQRVTIKSTGEVQQVKSGNIRPEQTRSPSQERRRSKEVSVYHKLLPGIGDKLAKSASSTAVSYERTIPIVREGEPTTVDKAVTTSISSIGGAVLRSKTEDIERMLRLQNATKQTKKVVVLSEEDKKAKRRYTDTRHQARIIPITTETADSQAGSSSPRGSEQRKSGVWKRRELISSEPKDRKGISQ